MAGMFLDLPTPKWDHPKWTLRKAWVDGKWELRCGRDGHYLTFGRYTSYWIALDDIAFWSGNEWMLRYNRQLYYELTGLALYAGTLVYDPSRQELQVFTGKDWTVVEPAA